MACKRTSLNKYNKCKSLMAWDHVSRGVSVPWRNARLFYDLWKPLKIQWKIKAHGGNEFTSWWYNLTVYIVILQNIRGGWVMVYNFLIQFVVVLMKCHKIWPTTDSDTSPMLTPNITYGISTVDPAHRGAKIAASPTTLLLRPWLSPTKYKYLHFQCFLLHWT